MAVVVLLSLLCIASCRRGRALSAAPVAGSGIRIELVTARAKGSSVDVTIMAYNDLGEEIVINRNQIAVTGPDGQDAYRTGNKELVVMPAKSKRPINFSVTGGKVDYAKAPGLFLRFDGISVGSARASIPAMALGQPSGAPGAAPPSSAVATRTASRAASAAASASAPSPSSSAQAPTVGLQHYDGSRQLIKSPGTKCAATPLNANGISKDITFIVDELLLTELQQAGFEAIGPDDINAMVGFEKTKQTVGCDDASCVAALGSALGVDYLVVGKLANLEGAVVLTLKVIDVRKVRVLARANRMAEGGKSALPRIIAEAVQELIQHAEL